MTFYQWMCSQKHRNDPIGDLGNDISKDTDPGCPIDGNPSDWLSYIRSRDVPEEVTRAVLQAAREYAAMRDE